MITLQVKIAPLLRDLKKYPKAYQRTLQEVVESEARGFVKDAIESTPPFHAKVHARGRQTEAKYQTVNGAAAKRAGEAKIDADLSGIFAGVKLKRTRKIPHLFGKTSTKSGRPPPYTVPTVEKHPDLNAIYDQRLQRKFDSGRKRISRGQKAKWYVSSAKLAVLRRERKAAVGKLAAGWAPAARKVKVKLPAWITRHSNPRGSVQAHIGRGSYSMTIRNSVPYGTRLALQAIADRVLQGRQGKLSRRLPHVLRGALRKARLEAMTA
jgi:hypothetical protein